MPRNLKMAHPPRLSVKISAHYLSLKVLDLVYTPLKVAKLHLAEPAVQESLPCALHGRVKVDKPDPGKAC